MMDKVISCLLLSGGTGSRMGAPIPKQYLTLHHKPIVLWSFDTLAKRAWEMVVVADMPFRGFFQQANPSPLFSAPGPRRQDSVRNGFLQARGDWILIHDAARPFIEEKNIDDLLIAAQKSGAAALAIKAESTMRIKSSQGLTWIDRDQLYQMQTPQLLHRDLLEAGLRKAAAEKVTVTDDVAFAELLGIEIALVEGSKKNIKITTDEDLVYANALAIAHAKI